MFNTTRIYVVTDRQAVFQMICFELGSEHRDIVQISQAALLAKPIEDRKPACVLVDVFANPGQGLASIAEIREVYRRAQVIAFGEHWDVASVVQAIKLGAFEVCEFPNHESRLKNAIRQAIQVEQQEGRELHELIPKSILERLTVGEARILRLLVEGRTTKEVGASLDVSVRTIHYRKKSILQKLGVQNRSEAIELIRVTQGSLATF